jgi:CubicO group peptidase (beta-lactamase class C family)
MQLVESGDVDLDAPITQYLPELAFQQPWLASDIAVHNLLAQNSGIPDQYLLFTVNDFMTTSLEDWHRILRFLPLNAPPNSFWNYANPNFSLAGLIVQNVTGTEYTNYVEQNVFRPAGMPLSTFKPDVVRAHGDYSMGHVGTTLIPPEYTAWAAMAPAGAAWSTPTEMVTWTLNLMSEGGDVLEPSSAAAMQTAQAHMDYRPWEDYGYGIFLTDYTDIDDTSQDIMVYDHGGNVTGFSSQLFWVPERRVAISILANTINSLSGSAHCALREIAGVQPKSSEGLTTDPSTWGLYEGTYAMMNQILWDYTAQFKRDGTHLVLHYLDLGTVAPLVQVLSDTFLPDLDGDGSPDQNTDFTFIRNPDDPNNIDWVRYRLMVGERVGDFPSSIAITGDGCGTLPFTADIDMPNLEVKVAGLGPDGPVVVAEHELTQDDPADPSTAGYRHDLSVEGEAGLFFVVLTPEEGNYADLYLLYDVNGDGNFVFPDEVASTGWSSSTNARLMLLSGRQPEGDYQLWVHGTQVQDPPKTFTLEIFLVDGTNLSIDSAPSAAVKGQSYEVEVCAADTAEIDESMRGMVEFSYGFPPRRVRIPVEWQPGQSPTPMPTATQANEFRIYLPVLAND